MTQLHFSGQDNQNEVVHNAFNHMMPLVLALASHDADNIINDTTAFLGSRSSKSGATCLFWSCDTTGADDMGIT